MNTTAFGNRGEQAASEYLSRLGYEIIDRNWKTKTCEIDIVAKKGNVVHFVEVKYRSTNRAGSGLDYITPKKLQQMQFAATLWTNEHNWRGEINLAAIEVSGETFDVTEFIESVY